MRLLVCIVWTCFGKWYVHDPLRIIDDVLASPTVPIENRSDLTYKASSCSIQSSHVSAVLYPALLVNNVAVSLLASSELDHGLLSALVQTWIPPTHMWVFLLEPWILSALFYLLWRSTSVLPSHCSSMPWYPWTLCCVTIRNWTTNPKHMGLRHSSRRTSKPDKHWTQMRENSNPDVLLVSLWSHWGKTSRFNSPIMMLRDLSPDIALEGRVYG